MSLVADAKALINEQMIIQRISKTEMARRTGLDRKEIDRILDMTHNTKMEKLEDVILHLGFRFSLSVSRDTREKRAT